MFYLNTHIMGIYDISIVNKHCFSVSITFCGEYICYTLIYPILWGYFRYISLSFPHDKQRPFGGTLFPMLKTQPLGNGSDGSKPMKYIERPFGGGINMHFPVLSVIQVCLKMGYTDTLYPAKESSEDV